MELPEKKLTGFIRRSEKAKWIPVNNHNVNKFTKAEIKRITNNYSTPVAKGGFGQVYRGSLDDGTIVAVKKYICQNVKDGFAKEIIVHCQINHKNVVRLLGYCSEDNALMIVTEYVPGGNLKDLLHGSDAPISLDARLRIAIECADALGYMHSSMYQPLIHGDIKPDNILLDNNLGVKLSDFGLSRLLSMHQTQYTQNVIGSRGYMDPEYTETGLLDPKSDVYSFGVVLLELITRAKASENGYGTGLRRKFTGALGKGKQEAREMFDTEIANEIDIEILDEIGNLAAQCFTMDIKERPEMKEVLGSLRMLRSRRSRMFESNGGSALEAAGVNIFTLKELERITRSYSHCISEDHTGFVYKGRIKNQEVAVKKLICWDRTFDREDFVNATVFVSQLRHMNIASLVGCCLETGSPLLVYEFAPRESLHDLLHCYNDDRSLTLDLRLDIAIGFAQALEYLQSKQFLCGNVTSTNILLDQSFVPKVSDIFSALLMSNSKPDFLLFHEYVDPVYLKTGYLTSKSDVYSFGIVLLELITRKQTRRNGFRPLNEYIKACRNENSGKAMFDEDIAIKGNMLILQEMGKLAVHCSREEPHERPEMVVVVERLQNLRVERLQNLRRDAH